MILRELTRKGMYSLESDILKFREIEHPEIDVDKYESKQVGEEFNIDDKKIFRSKLEAGKYFLEALKEHEPSQGVWNWLSLVYFKQLLNKKNRIGEVQRIFISPRKKTFYPTTNLLMPPYDICRFYKNDLKQIDFLLTDSINRNGSLYLEIAKRNDIVKNINFIKVARELFYDTKLKKIKPGGAKKKNVLRLIKIYKQYERGFDMYHMPSDRMIEIIYKKHKELSMFLC